MDKPRNLYLCVPTHQAKAIAREGLSSIARIVGIQENDPILHGIVCGSDPVDVLYDAPSEDEILLHIDADRIPDIISPAEFAGDPNPSQTILACGARRFTIPPSEIQFLDGYRFDPITNLAA
jgi:hypothetical protein